MPKGYSEAVIQRRQENTMINRKETKMRTMVSKTPTRRLEALHYRKGELRWIGIVPVFIYSNSSRYS